MENFDVPVDINSAITLKFNNGAIGNLSIVGDSPNWWEEHAIWGKKGAFYVRQGKLLEHLRGKEPRTPEDLPACTDTDRNFIDAILGRDEVHVPPECGLRVIELVEAAWESARTGKPVPVQIHELP
jgi:predicted dehydrogenase